jgi:hypothetical protein
MACCFRLISGGRMSGGLESVPEASPSPAGKREQFAVDAWRAPKLIFDTHPPDESAQLRVDCE